MFLYITLIIIILKRSLNSDGQQSHSINQTTTSVLQINEHKHAESRSWIGAGVKNVAALNWLHLVQIRDKILRLKKNYTVPRTTQFK